MLFFTLFHLLPDCTFDQLLSRSGDSTARIWSIPDGSSRSGLQNGALNVLVLKHVKGRTNEKSKDVTTLDWNVSYVTLIYFVIRPIKFLVIDLLAIWMLFASVLSGFNLLEKLQVSFLFFVKAEL